MDIINSIIIKSKDDIQLIPDYVTFIVKDLSDIIHKQGNYEYTIKTNKIPLLYFFDNYLNKNINISVVDRDKFIDSMKIIYKESNINRDYIININIDKHAVILYPFTYNERHYIYLSNSGLGIDNQNTFENKTSCKLFHIIGLDNLYKIHNMFYFIDKIINLIEDMSPIDYLSNILIEKQDLDIKIEKIWEKIHKNFTNLIGENVINRTFLSHFFKNIYENSQNKSNHIGYIDLVYVLLNYLAQVNFMNECTFHHLLWGSDYPIYTQLIRQLIFNGETKFSFEELYVNCLSNYNSEVYKLIRQKLDKEMPPMSNNFINDINIKLDEYASIKKTIQFKRNSIILELYNSGLYNYVQVGGSCVFYCFYNLLINNLFLTNYNLYKTNKIEAVQNVVNVLIYIHYTLLEYLCMCNDTNYLSVTNNFYPNQIFHMNYIYNIMINNNLMEEIIDFYPSHTLMIFSKTPLIDRLLDFHLSRDEFIHQTDYELYRRSDVIQLKKYFDEIDLLFNNYLNKLRSLENLSEQSLVRFRNQLYRVYNKIDQFYSTHDFLSISRQCDRYINIAIDIIIIYCYYLFKLYSGKTILKKYMKKSNTINFLYPVYWLPPNINLSNCGALSDCARKKCEASFYDTYYTYHIDFIQNKFNSYEIYSLSVLIRSIHIDIQTKISKLFNLEQCNYISIGTIELNNYDVYNNNINLESYDSVYLLERIISKYFRNKYLSNNLAIPLEQRSIYKKKCNQIIKRFKDIIKEIVNISSLSLFKSTIYELIIQFNEINYQTMLELLLFVISDGNYIFISKTTCENVLLFNFMTIMNENTQICYNSFSNDFILKKIYNYLIQNSSNDNSKDSIENHIEWIGKYNITFNKYDPVDDRVYSNDEDSTDHFYEDNFVYNNEDYQFDLKLQYKSSISIILARFGLHFENNDEFILLVPRSIILYGIFLERNKSFTFFICIKKTKTIIEINIINDSVDINNCYLLKNGKRHKLLFNIQLPFLSAYTETTPYLCYIDNNTTFVDIIVSSSFWSISSSKIYNYLLYKEDIDITNYKYTFDILEFQIAYSMTFPTIKTNNISYFLNIQKFYPSERILTFSKEQLVLQDLIINHINLDKITGIIKYICSLLCKNINCDEKTNEIFKKNFTNELSEVESRNAVLESFLKDNRLCIRFDFNEEIISKRDDILLELNRIYNEIRMIHNFDKSSYIISNLSNIILIMEINLLISELLNINMKTSCWDIQIILTKLDSILLCNEDIKQKSYYLYEYLFLFQNNYFFKENQMRKYKNILNDIKLNNSSLTIHQFMMGKGKTSFLTPLLSMAIYLFTGKYSVVITTEHLILQTIKYMRYIHYLGKILFSVVTDYEYKHVWLEQTDIELLKYDILKNQRNYLIDVNDIANTSLIIDEFNSHYDYNQSMFNLVKKQLQISEEMFNYIFDYMYSKIFEKPFVPTLIPELENNDIFNSVLDKEFNIAMKLKYNEKYGFNNIVGDIRLCIPYQRKDTPLIGSRFSSIILTILLTVHYYIKIAKYKLDEIYDYVLILKNYTNIIKILPKELMDEWYECIQQNNVLNIDIIKSTFEKLYSNLEIFLPILKKILYVINKKGLLFATEQYNVSFQDIIYNVYPNQWKVGYTGTIYLNPDIYFKEDTFVFKNKIEDFDERIEVKLALEGYGCPEPSSNNVNIIDTENTLLTQLQTILSSGINRGIVDIGGLFLDHTNMNIAKELHRLIPEKRIVYISELHEAIEYSDHTKNKYIPFHQDNFYYYDQCHIVGTDLEQPNEGCVAVIINKNTKWTEFSQGIFRFRKLNRGTYLKVFYIMNNDEKPEKDLMNSDILELIEKNEIDFEKRQELGVKFQLLKAMVRKISKNYLEDSLINEFILSRPITRNDCIDFFKNNIKDINSILLNSKDESYFTYIFDLYREILGHNEIMELIIGSDNIQKQIDMDIMIDIDVQKQSIERMVFDDNITYQYDIITHLHCAQCIHTTSVPLFLNDYKCYINEKPVVVSLNIALGFDLKYFIDTTLLIFVELPTIIILEIEYVAFDYYSHKFPIYDFNGNLLNTFLHNVISTHPYKLDIDFRFIYLFNIDNYINPIKEKNQDIITKQIIDDIVHNINIEACKIIFFLNRKLPNGYNNFFNITPIVEYLVKRYIQDDIITLIDIPEKDNNTEHIPEYRLDNIFLNRHSNMNGISLTIDTYTTIQRVPFQIIYDKYYYRLNSKP